MPYTRVPDDIVLRSFSVFRGGSRKRSSAALFAMDTFLDMVGRGDVDHKQAREKLDDKEAISKFISKIRADSRADRIRAKQKENADLVPVLEADVAKQIKEFLNRNTPENEKKRDRRALRNNLAFFLLGTIASGPFASVLFKHQV